MTSQGASKFGDPRVRGCVLDCKDNDSAGELFLHCARRLWITFQTAAKVARQ